MASQDSGSSTGSKKALLPRPHAVFMAASVLAISACGGDGGPVEPENDQPVAQLSVTPEQGYTGTVFEFDGNQSYDPDGSISSYNWTYGDGNSGSGMNTEHTYTSEGNYEACLTVTDNQGATNRSCLENDVLVERPEQIAFARWDVITEDNWDQHIYVGDLIRTEAGQDTFVNAKQLTPLRRTLSSR